MIDGKPCLLVVDDEEDARSLFRRHFKRLGYEVLEAGDGLEALALFEEHPREVDLVITDIRMPRMDGEQLIRELRQRRQFLPILGVTGHADLQGRLAIIDSGAYYYLDKPIAHWTIVERLVQNAIRLHHHEEELHDKRQKELQIARLLRAYIVQSPIHFTTGAAGASRRLALDIHFEPIEMSRPGGDYVDWFDRGEEEVLFYLADASGHDISAAFAACLSSMVLHRCHHHRRPRVDEIIAFIDQALDVLRAAGAWEISRYLTFFVGCLDMTTGTLTYVNAGHPEALLLRPNPGAAPTIHRLHHTCGTVGHLSLIGRPIEVGTEQLTPGDLLFLYTDGASELLEAPNDPKSGIHRLAATVESVVHEPARTVVERVKELLHQQVGDDGFGDDTTLMAIRVLAG